MRPEAVPIHLGNDEKDCPPFERAPHRAICKTCGKEYWQHQQYSWGSFPLYLHKLCDGSFIKP